MTKILLVEDDKSLREIYGVRLLAEGYDIVSAGDGEEALAMSIKERPQLIISDVMMPKISGFDMLDILRSTTETKDIKVIIMTALSSDDQRERGESLGADRYLVKSQVGIEDVVRTVHEVLGDAPIANQSKNVFTPNAPKSTDQIPRQFNQPQAHPVNTAGNPASAQAPIYAPPQLQQTPPTIPRPASLVTPSVNAFPQQPSHESSISTPQKPTFPINTNPTNSVAPPHPAMSPISPSNNAPIASAPQQTASPEPAPAAAPSLPPVDPPEAGGLPQPTAPFSTNRPSGLGDRIIHPLPPKYSQANDNLGTLMDKELTMDGPNQPLAPTPEPLSPKRTDPNLSNPIL